MAEQFSTAHANRHRKTLSLLCLAAAGGSVEPFWGLYQQHQKPEIRDILSKYRVGTLKGAPKMAAVQEVRALDLTAAIFLLRIGGADLLPTLPGACH